MPALLKNLSAITLFVEDLPATRNFYQEILELPLVFEGDTSAVYDLGNTIINLLMISEAPELMTPATVGNRDTGSRELLTITVEDVDAMCAELASRGVELLNGPMDRPWGIRTASFADPAGHIWEIAH